MRLVPSTKSPQACPVTGQVSPTPLPGPPGGGGFSAHRRAHDRTEHVPMYCVTMQGPYGRVVRRGEVLSEVFDEVKREVDQQKQYQRTRISCGFREACQAVVR